MLEIDADQLRTFADSMFRHASDGQFIALRTFDDNKKSARPVIEMEAVQINGNGLAPVREMAERMAAFAANHTRRAVFCPPIAGFSRDDKADKASLSEGYAISVECDARPNEARETLERLLGPATIIVASGGFWTNPTTGGISLKLHLHWRLKRPATGDDLARLEDARRLAAKLVGGDPSNVPVSHPIRWPGSVHRKGEPRLATIVSQTENELDLDQALDLLGKAQEPPRTAERLAAEPATGGAIARAFVGGLLAQPATVGTRSEAFFDAALMAVGTFGMCADTFEVLCVGNPDGCAGKYIKQGKLRENIDAAFAKIEPPELGEPIGLHDDDFDAPPNDAAKEPLLKSSRDFVAGFTPPDYLVDGLLQRRFCYSLTGQTGSGKTALSLLIAANVARGLPVGGRETTQGRVLFMAGENPDDIRMRWLMLARAEGFDVDAIDVHFIPGVFSLSKLGDKVRVEIAALGGVALVVVDTSAAYFEGDDENKNVQAGAHARLLRSFCKLEGGPTVLVNCHPVKSPNADNIVPRGGGAFLAEVDGNLTAVRADMMLTLHWQGKFRGPDFPAVTFELVSDTTPRLKDSKGKSIYSVYARGLSQDEERAKASASRANEDALLIVLLEGGPMPLSAIAGALNLTKAKVQRLVTAINKGGKYIDADRTGTFLTVKGKKAAREARYNRDATGATYG